MSPEMINAIAGLWKLVAAIAVLSAIFLFRKPLVERLGKLSRVKAKDTEVEFFDEKKEEDSNRLASVPPPPKLGEDETDKSLIADTHSSYDH